MVLFGEDNACVGLRGGQTVCVHGVVLSLGRGWRMSLRIDRPVYLT